MTPAIYINIFKAAHFSTVPPLTFSKVNLSNQQSLTEESFDKCGGFPLVTCVVLFESLCLQCEGEGRVYAELFLC